jgi:hypothetical protein
MIFLFLISSVLAYEPIKSLSFDEEIQKRSLFFEGQPLNYSFYKKKKTSYSKQLIENAILASSLSSLSKIKEIKNDIVPCRPNETLEIYELSISQLNDKERFPEVFSYNKNVWGYFDPRPKEKNINSILVTQQSEFNGFQILTHEIAHHWYSAYCLEEYTSMTSEEFAVKVQFSLESQNVYN